MKPYQDHCPIKDKGKAIPHPKQPTRCSIRRPLRGYSDRELKMLKSSGIIRVTGHRDSTITSFVFL